MFGIFLPFLSPLKALKQKYFYLVQELLSFHLVVICENLLRIGFRNEYFPAVFPAQFPTVFPAEFPTRFPTRFLTAFSTEFPKLDGDWSAPLHPFQMLNFHQSLLC